MSSISKNDINLSAATVITIVATIVLSVWTPTLGDGSTALAAVLLSLFSFLLIYTLHVLSNLLPKGPGKPKVIFMVQSILVISLSLGITLLGHQDPVSYWISSDPYIKKVRLIEKHDESALAMSRHSKPEKIYIATFVDSLPSKDSTTENRKQVLLVDKSIFDKLSNPAVTSTAQLCLTKVDSITGATFVKDVAVCKD